MPRIAYTVIAQVPDEATRDEYIAWLKGGHIARVIEGGADSAAIVVLDRNLPDDAIAVEVRYEFASRAALERYFKLVAPALRAEGLRKFPAERGVVFRRMIGEIA